MNASLERKTMTLWWRMMQIFKRLLVLVIFLPTMLLSIPWTIGRWVITGKEPYEDTFFDRLLEWIER